MEIPSVHQKAMDSHQLEEVLLCSNKIAQQQQQERKVRPHPEQALKCPRCASTNTKFCYYNNYSLSQPRYFCKGCRRYWTQGGSLRNVPVGGGCRKNKRSSSTTSAKMQAHESPARVHMHATNSNPLLPAALVPPALSYDPNDLTLAFASLQKQPTKQLGLQDGHSQSALFGHANTAPLDGFLDILRSGFIDTSASTSPFNNLYYGFGANCNNVEVGSAVCAEGGGVFSSDHSSYMGATGSTVTSQGSCKDVDEGETKVLMGLPWQVAAGNGSIAVDSGRDYWTGVNSWHGLVNSSLM